MQPGSCRREAPGMLQAGEHIPMPEHTDDQQIIQSVRVCLEVSEAQTYHRASSPPSRLRGQEISSWPLQPPQHTFVRKRVRPGLSFARPPYYLLGWWK